MHLSSQLAGAGLALAVIALLPTGATGAWRPQMGGGKVKRSGSGRFWRVAFMIRRRLHLALFVLLPAGLSFAANGAPAQKAMPPVWERCQGGTGISADAQIASCTEIIDAARQSRLSRAEALRIRCLLVSEKGRNSAAIADCSRAVALDPKNTESYLTRGKAYRNANEFDLAIADFNTALAAKPHSPGLLTLRGLAYYQKGDYDRAIADYTEAIKLWPEVRLPKSLLAQAMAAKARRESHRK